MSGWHPNGGNTRRYGETMCTTDAATCYVEWERVVADGHDTSATDGYRVAVYKPNTYKVFGDCGTSNVVMSAHVDCATLDEAQAYVDAWLSITKED